MNHLLYKEIQIYEALKDGIGIPKLIWYDYKYDTLITELLDKSLDYYFKTCNYKFSLLTKCC